MSAVSCIHLHDELRVVNNKFKELQEFLLLLIHSADQTHVGATLGRLLLTSLVRLADFAKKAARLLR